MYAVYAPRIGTECESDSVLVFVHGEGEVSASLVLAAARHVGLLTRCAAAGVRGDATGYEQFPQQRCHCGDRGMIRLQAVDWCSQR
jgi:hypothetical protein